VGAAAAGGGVTVLGKRGLDKGIHMSVQEQAPDQRGAAKEGRPATTVDDEQGPASHAAPDPSARPKRRVTFLEATAVLLAIVVFSAIAVLRPWQDGESGTATGTDAQTQADPGDATDTATDSAAPASDEAAGATSPAEVTAPEAAPSPAAEGPAPDGREGGGPSSSTEYLASIAVAVSQQIHPAGGAEEIVLIRDKATGDSLAAGSLIGLFDTTFLITGSEELPATTVAELNRLGTPRVHILGGPMAISMGIEEELRAAGHNVHRHAGPAQADTAVDIAQAHFPEARTAVLVRTPDGEAGPVEAISSALAATAMAAAQDLPMLMSASDTLPAATAALLESAAVRRVIVVGSRQEIGPEVTARLDELGIGWDRWGGQDRFDNAVQIARNRGFQTLAGAEVVVLVEGGHDSVWPAGFLGSVVAARANGPVLLTQADELPAATADYLATGDAQVELVCTPGVTQRSCAAAGEILGRASR
jgi:putative cell wall-binding protein